MVLGKTKVKKGSGVIIAIGVTLILTFAALANFGFGLFDVQGQLLSLITLIAGFFVLAEVGWFMSIRSRKSGNAINVIAMFVALATIIVGILGFFGTTLAFLSPIAGTLQIALIFAAWWVIYN